MSDTKDRYFNINKANVQVPNNKNVRQNQESVMIHGTAGHGPAGEPVIVQPSSSEDGIPSLEVNTIFFRRMPYTQAPVNALK